MQRWFPEIDVWIWCFVFAAILFALNAIPLRVCGESEFWLALIKVAPMVGQIVLGGAALFGSHYLAESGYTFLGENLETPQGLLPHGITGVLITTLAVFYAFSGSELIGAAAGETANPAVNISKACAPPLFAC